MRTLISLITLSLLLSGCEVIDGGPRPVPKYAEAQFVCSVLTHDRGQITSRRCYAGRKTCIYAVRFPAPQTRTHTSLFGDGPIESQPLALITDMDEYELEACR